VIESRVGPAGRIARALGESAAVGLAAHGQRQSSSARPHSAALH
jgi:hypothetical protein